jgi:transcriptional regulator with GAF, ATPase, and Fis domain
MSAQITPIRSATQGATTVLIVSASEHIQEELAAKLKAPRWAHDSASSGAHALERLFQASFDLLLLDPALPDLAVDEFKHLVQMHFAQTQIVTVNPHTGMPYASNSAPLAGELIEVLGHRQVDFELAPNLGGSAEQATLPGMVGNSEPMKRVYKLARMVAPHDSTVLITGQSGTGKEVLANAIHELSNRRRNPMAVINCAAIPETLLESELFGYAKGAFTGAVQSKQGRIHAAHGGTLFLDEIGEMPLMLQAKLLRFLEQGELQRLGSSETFRVDVRVIAATNARLERMVEEKQFREDLYYRLAVFPIYLPPLAERTGDIVPLALSYLSRFCRRTVAISPEALNRLEAHSWPGNVRELRNVMERACILANSEPQVGAEHIIL